MNSILDIACFSNKEPNKENNEDFYLPPTFDNEFNIVLAIADGVGTASSAKLASNLAIEAVRECLKESEFSIESAFARAKKEIDKIEINTATTLTIIHILSSEVIIGHLGDCRAYFKKGNKLTQITRDQTRYQDLLDSGEHKMKNLRNHKERLSSILTSALSRKTELQYDKVTLSIDDIVDGEILDLYLMSDGAYKHWHLRPKFSDKTMNSPAAFASSLKKRIEKNIDDDYTLLALKILKNKN